MREFRFFEVLGLMLCFCFCWQIVVCVVLAIFAVVALEAARIRRSPKFTTLYSLVPYYYRYTDDLRYDKEDIDGYNFL